MVCIMITHYRVCSYRKPQVSWLQTLQPNLNERTLHTKISQCVNLNERTMSCNICKVHFQDFVNCFVTLLANNTSFRSQIWSRIDWLAGPKIRIAGISFDDFEMEENSSLKLYLPLSGKSEHQLQ